MNCPFSATSDFATKDPEVYMSVCSTALIKLINKPFVVDNLSCSKNSNVLTISCISTMHNVTVDTAENARSFAETIVAWEFMLKHQPIC